MLIARQPIFNKELEVYGYELLFRAGKDSVRFDGTSSMQATASVMTNLFESGIDQIVDGKQAFINFDAEFINSDLPELIDSDRLIIEVLENVEADVTLTKRIIQLKEEGYTIALDDFSDDYATHPLVPYADIIKFDILVTPLDTLKEAVKTGLAHNKTLLAEKIETLDQFVQAKLMGFHLFQGYFFSKPHIIGNPNKKPTTKFQYGLLISELNKVEPSYQMLAEIIEKDVNLAYRLMRIVRHRTCGDLVCSIKIALTYMGLKEIERWITILMIQDLGESKPKELIRLSLIRTKFAELISIHGGFGKLKNEASMMGLFSTIDALLDRNMEEALSDIALPICIVESLVKEEGELVPIYQLVKAYEKGDWDTVKQIAEKMNLSEEVLAEDYISSTKWASEIVLAMYGHR